MEQIDLDLLESCTFVNEPIVPHHLFDAVAPHAHFVGEKTRHCADVMLIPLLAKASQRLCIARKVVCKEDGDARIGISALKGDRRIPHDLCALR